VIAIAMAMPIIPVAHRGVARSELRANLLIVNEPIFSSFSERAFDPTRKTLGF
jgi:hypothetical protein